MESAYRNGVRDGALDITEILIIWSLIGQRVDAVNLGADLLHGLHQPMTDRAYIVRQSEV
jgi:hypothetical protein